LISEEAGGKDLQQATNNVLAVMMCGSPPLLVTDGATHVKNIAAGRIEQIIDEAIGPTIISWLSYTPKLRLLIRSAEKYRDAQNSNFVQCTSPRRIISSLFGRDS